MRQKGHACRQAGIVGIFVLVLVLAIAVAGGAYYLGRVSTKLQPVKTQQPAQIAPSPDPTANWKTYTNIKGGYSIKYPSELNVSENTGIYTNQIIPSATINPPHVNGELDESIFIDVREVSTNSTINDYLTQHVYPGNINSIPFTLDSQSGIRTKDIPGQFEYDTVIVKKDLKIYDIRLLEASGNVNWKIIGETTFNQILSTFKFLDQTATPTTSPEGKFCGGFAGNLPENQCPTGYRCQLDYTRRERTDSGGKCVKE